MQPAQYHRKTKQWRKLLGKTGVVLLATRIEVTTKELEEFLPYSFLLIELNEVTETGKKQRLEIMGEAKTDFSVGEKVMIELRKNAILDEKSIIPYDLKACKL